MWHIPTKVTIHYCETIATTVITVIHDDTKATRFTEEEGGINVPDFICNVYHVITKRHLTTDEDNDCIYCTPGKAF